MPTVVQSPTTDKQSTAAAVEPTAITAFRTRPLPGAWNREDVHAIDTDDGRTIEISHAEWRALINELRRIDGIRLIHRHLGLELTCEGILLEVIQ